MLKLIANTDDATRALHEDRKLRVQEIRLAPEGCVQVILGIPVSHAVDYSLFGGLRVVPPSNMKRAIWSAAMLEANEALAVAIRKCPEGLREHLRAAYMIIREGIQAGPVATARSLEDPQPSDTTTSRPTPESSPGAPQPPAPNHTDPIGSTAQGQEASGKRDEAPPSGSPSGPGR